MLDIETVASIVKNRKSDESSLLQALYIIRSHIDYCINNNINMWNTLIPQVL